MNASFKRTALLPINNKMSADKTGVCFQELRQFTLLRSSVFHIGQQVDFERQTLYSFGKF